MPSHLFKQIEHSRQQPFGLFRRKSLSGALRNPSPLLDYSPLGFPDMHARPIKIGLGVAHERIIPAMLSLKNIKS